jgi:hypothetical protein
MQQQALYKGGNKFPTTESMIEFYIESLQLQFDTESYIVSHYGEQTRTFEQNISVSIVSKLGSS